MDWSLMLMSQGIESVIDHSVVNGWGLIVPANEYERALDLIRQYRSENRRWPWRSQIPGELLFDWAGLAWVCLVVLFYLGSERGTNLRTAGMMDSQAVLHGQWWRLFTAMFLHADPGHLTANVVFGFVLLGLVMGIYGTGIGLLAAFLAGAGGNLMAWVIDPHHLSLGASGMVMGCLGLLVGQAASLWQKNPRTSKSMLAGIIAGGMLFLLLGSSPGSDLVAHLGGFIFGIALGILLRVVRFYPPKPLRDLFAGAIFTLLVILTWWFALSAEKSIH